ncbi:MAG: hypothetical protein HKP58_17485, partial [Desulfatitalea sp.]|nr:trimethylamine methyltransferase family protein [Desulfatitalea sp.]NNK02207.1 hypothetical protein [Desulfatitalea sp.]
MPMQLLTKAKINKIDAAGRQILKRVGIKVLNPALCRRLQRSGAEVDLENLRVRLPDAWLETHLQAAPTAFTLYGRETDHDLQLGTGRTHFGNGGRVFQMLDMQSGRMRPTILRDIADTAAVVAQMPHIQFFIIPCQAHDLPAETY